VTTWIALLRGVNVGGNNPLPMADLRALLGGLGYAGVRTYIQSGNCVFRADTADASALEAEIAAAIDGRFGFRPDVFVLSREQLDDAVAGNPYAAAAGDPKSVHLMFLARPADGADLAGLETVRADSEAFTLTAAVFYLHAPDGIGRSKLVDKLGKYVPVSMTGRNLRSVRQIADLAAAVAAEA